jgi:coenzyme F420-reducing hydrogenase delta subunit
MLSHIGIEPERLQFSWISSAESTKFVDVVTEVVEAIRKVGPNTKLVKNMARKT